MPTPTLLGDSTETASLSEAGARLRARLATLRIPERALPLAIVLAVVAVFSIGLRNDFVYWDDHRNILENLHFRGFGWAQLRWMFTTTLMGHYIPLTWLTFALDYVLWGLQPAGYHFTSLVLHAANAAVFYWIAKRVLTAALPATSEIALRAGALVAGLFFAIHPLRAESVAWATERRDVLSGLLFLVCVLLYLRAASSESAQRRRQLLTLATVAFALAMLAKSIVMTLPVLLVVIDWYPLRRLQPLRWSAQTRRVLLEKLPFMTVGAVGAAVSYWAVQHQGFLTESYAKYPLPSRISMALYSMVFYLSKTVVPTDLSPLYELPKRVDPLASQFLAATVAVVLLAVTLVPLARRWPAPLAAYAWYAIVLAPVGGLVHSGFQLAHDRYSYLSCLPFAVLLGGGVAWLVNEHAAGRLNTRLFGVSASAVAALLLSFGVLTWLQVQVWRNTESLWTQATYAAPDCSICHNNYAAILVNRPQVSLDEQLIAISHFEQALILRPDSEKVYGGLGLVFLHLGRFADAEAALRRAIARAPVEIGPYNNLGFALNQQGRFAEAVPFLRRGLSADEHNIIARANLGQALVGSGHLDEGIAELRRAADEQPYAPEPRIGLVLAYRQAHNTAEMRKQLTILRQLHPAAARDLATQHKL
jgi:protein O-mannosyl-transferase